MMKTIRGRITRIAGLVLLSLGTGISLQASSWHIGDVFAAIPGGKYRIFRPSTGQFIDTFIDNVTNGQTRGCAIDLTYHLVGTDATNSTVNQFRIFDPSPPSPESTNTHPVIRSSTAGTSANSVAIDGNGSMFVGNGLRKNSQIVKLDTAGNSVTFSLPNSSIDTTLVGLDLDASGGTVYFVTQGRTIGVLNVSNGTVTTLSIGGVSGNFNASGIRVLPANNSSGFSNAFFLIAGRTSSSSSVLLLNSSGALLKQWSILGETDLEALALDPVQRNADGTTFTTLTHFWVGGRNTGNVFHIDLSMSGTLDPSALTHFQPGLNVNGLATFAGFSLAEPVPTVITPALPLSTTTVTLPNGTTTTVATADFQANCASTTGCVPATTFNNELKVSFSGFTGNVNTFPLIALASAVPPPPNHSGDSDPSVGTVATAFNGAVIGTLPCRPSTTGTPSKCVTWILQPDEDQKIDPNAQFTGIALEISATGGSGTDNNTRLLLDEAFDVSTGVIADPVTGGTDGGSVYSINEATATNGTCTYLPPVDSGNIFNNPGNIKWQFGSSTCPNLPSNVNICALLVPRLSIVQIPPTGVNIAPLPFFPPQALTGGTAGPSPLYRCDVTGQQFNLNIDFSGISGCFLGTTYDDAKVISPFSAVIGVNLSAGQTCPGLP